MTWEDVVCICKSIDTLTKAVDMYLLDISCVLILPEYMYLNVSDKEIRYVYCPDANREFQTMLKDCLNLSWSIISMEQIVRIR